MCSTIPWAEIVEHQLLYLNSAHVPAPVVFKGPCDMLGAHVQLFYTNILAFQDTNSPALREECQVFKTPSDEIEDGLEEIAAHGELPDRPLNIELT